MEFLIPFIKTAHIGVALIMIVVILIQPGGSDELGTVFGGGSSESVFGAGGATPFLAKATRFMAVVFVLTSLSLGYMSFKRSSSSVIDKGFVETPAETVDTEPEATAPFDSTEETVEVVGSDISETPADTETQETTPVETVETTPKTEEITAPK